MADLQLTVNSCTRGSKASFGLLRVPACVLYTDIHIHITKNFKKKTFFFLKEKLGTSKSVEKGKVNRRLEGMFRAAK